MARVIIRDSAFIKNRLGGIAHGANDELIISGSRFEENGLAGIVNTSALPAAILLSFFTEIKASQEAGVKPDLSSVADKSGLANYAKEHGLELGEFLLNLSQTIGSDPTWIYQALQWVRGLI